MSDSEWAEFNRLKSNLISKYGLRPTAGLSQGYTPPLQKKQKIQRTRKKHLGQKPGPILFFGYNTVKG